MLRNVDERPARGRAEAADSADGDVAEPAAGHLLGQRVDETVGAQRQAASRLAHVGADSNFAGGLQAVDS